MSVRVNVHHYFLHSPAVDWISVVTSGTTVGECLNNVVAEYPELKKAILDPEGNLPGHVSAFVNGEDSFPEELTRELKDGDIVDIIPVIGGG